MIFILYPAADTSLPLLSTLSALTTIELAVPDYAVGGLLGEKVCLLMLLCGVRYLPVS